MRQIAAVVVTVLFFSAVIPFLRGDVLLHNNLVFVYGDTVLICTEDGIRFIALDEFDADNLPQSKRYCNYCVLCDSSQQKANEIAYYDFFFEQVAYRFRLAEYYVDILHENVAVSDLRLRDPPVV